MAEETANDKNPDNGTKAKASPAKRRRKWVYRIAAVLGISTAAAIEIKTSFIQSTMLTRIAQGKMFSDVKTTDCENLPPALGPYDQRLGYANASTLCKRLDEKGYLISAQNQWLDRNVFGFQLFPIYNEKAQAGLRIADDTDANLFLARYPRNVFNRFEDIPPVLVNTLLYVENRDLLSGLSPTRNPAIEWERFVNAFIGYGLRGVGLPVPQSGGSTLATQLEKFRHSPDGITRTPADKLRQMLTASVRPYKEGMNTVQERRQIVLDYLNSMPLASYPGYGEVHGFADGISMWFGTDFKDASRLLSQPEDKLSDDELRQVAKVYRQSISLVMAVKKPSAYLLQDRDGLQNRVERFLPALVEAGIISERMKDMVLSEPIEYPASRRFTAEAQPKTVQTLQIDLLKTLGMGSIYDLERLDMTARTTVDAGASDSVAKVLRSLTTPEGAATAGITGYQLLRPESVGQVIYSFTLYEKTAEANVLRVQTDNFNGQFNLNEGSKLELGSTAKLRTLVSYLEAVADLHARYAVQDAESLKTLKISPSDNLTTWAVQYLSAEGSDKSLNAMLEASLDRKYSASTAERFFTGGGIHTFSNFKKEDNGRIVTVRESFHHSINLPFIRMMRDVVNYSMTHKMNVDPAIFQDSTHPLRTEYLNKFADAEGQTFMWKHWKEQRDLSPAATAAHLAGKTRRTPNQLAVLYRSLYPEAPYESMETFIRQECKTCSPSQTFQKQYEDYAPGKFDLNDRAYLTRLHPLELWLATHRQQNPETKWAEAVEASAAVRLESYKWLFKSDNLQGQNTRIRTMLEREAFEHIEQTWKGLGFPFENMIPSYASALGASGDTPASLSTLAGILQNDGGRQDNIRFRSIEFGKNTPYQMNFAAQPAEEKNVLHPLVAQITRREMQNVVSQGTARRANNAVTLSDGRVLPLGGKTGTGDNRSDTFSAGGAVRSSNVTSRTAAFVFSIDDRFFGTLIAYVPGDDAADFKFTSALPVQVFKNLVPAIRPVLDRAYDVKPPPAPEANADSLPKPPAPKA